MIDKEVDFETFFKKCKLNPNAHLITGTICGYRIEDLESPLIKQARFMDKLVDELAKGRKMKKCCAPKKLGFILIDYLHCEGRMRVIRMR